MEHIAQGKQLGSSRSYRGLNFMVATAYNAGRSATGETFMPGALPYGGELCLRAIAALPIAGAHARL